MSDFLNSNMRLDDWLRSQATTGFPNNEPYPSRYDNILSYLKRDIYREIEKGALIAAVKAGSQPLYLNNHGEEHNQQLIDLATKILKEIKYNIPPYEAYLLLVAILLHDIGNILGRENHEKQCCEVMDSIGQGLLPDTPERRAIAEIAAAHGGFINGSKDTLGKLKEEDHLRNTPVKPRLLASLLRLADELADDERRASRFMFEHQLLEGSEVYHAYSLALKSVIITADGIELKFEFEKKFAIKYLKKGDGSIFLIDEIFKRTFKMHLERIYCMRHCRIMAGEISRINVQIKIYESFKADELTKPPIETITYSLEEGGYPESPEHGIYAVCPGLDGINGQKIKDKFFVSKFAFLKSLWKK